jgi:hypothetical protein
VAVTNTLSIHLNTLSLLIISTNNIAIGLVRDRKIRLQPTKIHFHPVVSPPPPAHSKPCDDAALLWHDLQDPRHDPNVSSLARIA